METPKLKNVVLIILVVTNLCLLIFVAQSEWKGIYLRWQARAQAIHFLEQKEVDVDESLIPREVDLQPGTAERSLEWEEELAVQLLSGPVEMENRGAGVYRYQNEQGFVQFHSDGAFQAEFVPGAVPISDNWERDCLDLLSRIGFDGRLMDDAGGRWVFCQMWQDCPLFSCQVTVEEGDGCVVALTSGRRLVGKPAQDSSRQTITVSTALIRLYNGINGLGDVCSRIDAIEAGYVTSSVLSSAMAVTPVWQVTTDTGLYQLDLVTGSMTRIS